jgi:hypothetical protein
MPLSDELKALYCTAPYGEYYIETLTLEHPLFPGGIRYITNRLQGWGAELETGQNVFFEYLPFAVIPPDKAEQAAVELKVGLDNTSRALMDELENLSTQPTDPISLTYRLYLESDTTTVQNDPPLVLEVVGVTATQTSISFVAGLLNLRSKPFPSQLYSIENFPGLVR